ncbi:hypothetical protein Tco_0553060 [Tanacetum coccineum]
MTRSTIKRLTKPLDKPERELRRLKRVAWRLQQNESLAIAGRNLCDAEASSSNNTGANPPTPPKTLHENSHLNPSSDRATRDASRLRFLHFSLKGKVAEWLDRIPPTQITTWDQLVSRFLDHFFLGNSKRKEKGEDGLDWTIRSRFEDELAKFMLEKKSHTKGIGEMFDQHHKELHEQFSQILSTIRKSESREPEAPIFAITTRSGVNTQDPPFLAPSQSTSANHTKGQPKKKGLRTQNQTSYKNLPLGHPSFTNPPSRPICPFRPD